RRAPWSSSPSWTLWTAPSTGLCSSLPKPGKASGGSDRRRLASRNGAVRPLSSTGTRSIECDRANRPVPWLGTRSAGEFWTFHRPRNGSARSSGTAPFIPSVGRVEVGGAQRPGDGTGDPLQLLHLLVEVDDDVLQRPEAEAGQGTADDPAAGLCRTEAVEAVAVELVERLEGLVECAQAVDRRAREDRVQQQELDRPRGADPPAIGADVRLVGAARAQQHHSPRGGGVLQVVLLQVAGQHVHP